MLLCRLALRTLHHRHHHLATPAICTAQRTRLPARRSYSSPSGGDQPDEGLDLSRRSADSAYLDFLLGTESGLSDFSFDNKSKTTAATGSTGPESSHPIRNGRTPLSPGQMRRECVKRAARAARRRRAPLTFYEIDKPERTADRLAYDAETHGKVKEVSQWRLGEDGQEGPTISVKRIVPAIAPARAPPQASGVEYRVLQLQPYQRSNAAYCARDLESAPARTRRAEIYKRYMVRRAARARNITIRRRSLRRACARIMANPATLAEFCRTAGNEVVPPAGEDSRTKDWKKRLAAFRHRLDQRTRQCGEVVLLATTHLNAGAWAASALQGGSGLRRSGLAMDLRNRTRWQEAALWLLSRNPERVTDFLVITHRYSNARDVSDILQLLAERLASSQDTAAAKDLAALADAFPRLADRGTRRPLRFRSRFFRLLMLHCSHDQVDELYRAMRSNRVGTSWLTWLYFAKHLARSGQFEQALETIIESSRAGAKHDSTAFLSTCATLLRAAIREPSGLRVCLRVVDNFVKLGVTLNIQLCNIVMLNAVEAGDQQTAFAVYNSLVEHGLQADACTYAILLKGCKAAIDDADGLNSTIRRAIEHIEVARELIVATEILHCLARHHSKHHPDRAFDTVVDAYAQLFDLEPLRKLGVVLPHLSARVHPDAERMQPDKHVVHIMIAAYLDHTFRQTRSTANAYELYQRFLELADNGVQPFRGLLETDYTANSFMATFGKTKKGLIRAAEVIKDMQRESRECCRPTVQTWTIFLHSFTRHGQMKLAEQVLSYMTDKGMRPNQVTWNVLTAGYATAQDVNGTLDALQRMEMDGKVRDGRTEGGLKNLKDQRALAQLTPAQYTRRLQMDVDADLKEGLLDRISSVEEGKVEERQVHHVDGSHIDGMTDSHGDQAEAEDVIYTVYSPF